MIDGEYRRCAGHAGDEGDAPWFCGDACRLGDDPQDEEPRAAEATDTGHPNVLVLQYWLPGPEIPKVLALSVPNNEVGSGRSFLRALDRVLFSGRQPAVVLREGWDLGFVALDVD